MKRIFAIMFSAAMLISAAIFVSCGGDDSSSGGGGDNYYQGGDDGSSSGTGSDNDFSGGNISGNQEFVTIPSAPKNVTAKATSSSSIEVSWDAVDGADSYAVYYRSYLGVGNDNYEINGTETSKTTTNTSISITDLEYKMYLFWVTAKNSAGESRESIFGYGYPSYSSTGSGGSSSGSGSSGTTTTTLSAPTGVTAIEDSSSSIRLSWNSVSGATGYEVYCSIFSSPSYASLIKTTTATSTTISGTEANTTYYFWVKATNGTTKSNWSSYDYVITTSSSSAPSRGTLKIINNSSYTIKNLMLYTADYDLSNLSGMESLSCTVYKGTTEIVSNVYPGYYVEIGSKSYGGYKVKTYKTVVIQSGITTTLIITDSDIISN